jgi:hypothetical protein
MIEDRIQEDRIRQFIQENHTLVKEYHLCYHARYKEIDFKEQLRILFVNAISAGGQGGINQKADSIREFKSKIDDMKNKTWDELLRVFDVKSYQELFKSLKKFKQMKSKKSALFLRDILYFDDVISEFPPNLKKELLVPVDEVIRRTINSLFDRKYTEYNAFDEITELSKEIFPDEPILLEDLWFWGRFYCRKDEKNNVVRPCEFNENLLEVDENVTKDYREKLLKFADTHLECPFENVCENRFKKAEH